MTGMTKLLNSPADGYSLAVLIGDTYALLAGPKPAFNADQVIPLAIMIQQPSGLWVNSNSPWKTWQDFVEDGEREGAQGRRCSASAAPTTSPSTI